MYVSVSSTPKHTDPTEEMRKELRGTRVTDYKVVITVSEIRRVLRDDDTVFIRP